MAINLRANWIRYKRACVRIRFTGARFPKEPQKAKGQQQADGIVSARTKPLCTFQLNLEDIVHMRMDGI